MEAVHLSAEESLRVSAAAAKGLIRIVSVQLIALIIASLIFWALVSFKFALWSFIGGLTYFLPSAFVVLRLLLRLFAKRQASVVALFMAEGIKVLACIVLLVLIARYFKSDVNWLALLIGMIVTMKSYFLLIIFNKF